MTGAALFDAGGHSLLAVELFSGIKKEFGLELPLALLFQTPTIQELAEHIDTEIFRTRSATKGKVSSPEDEREQFEF